MASAPIVHCGSYEHYKTRTKIFITWLTNTAHTCCRLSDVVGALKSRKGKNTKNDNNIDEVLLTTREIVTLCDKIAGNQKVKVPEWILKLLKTIMIGVRQSQTCIQLCRLQREVSLKARILGMRTSSIPYTRPTPSLPPFTSPASSNAANG